MTPRLYIVGLYPPLILGVRSYPASSLLFSSSSLRYLFLISLIPFVIPHTLKKRMIYSTPSMRGITKHIYVFVYQSAYRFSFPTKDIASNCIILLQFVHVRSIMGLHFLYIPPFPVAINGVVGFKSISQIKSIPWQKGHLA